MFNLNRAPKYPQTSSFKVWTFCSAPNSRTFGKHANQRTSETDILHLSARARNVYVRSSTSPHFKLRRQFAPLITKPSERFSASAVGGLSLITKPGPRREKPYIYIYTLFLVTAQRPDWRSRRRDKARHTKSCSTSANAQKGTGNQGTRYEVTEVREVEK